MYMLLNNVSDCAKSLELTTLVVFLFWLFKKLQVSTALKKWTTLVFMHPSRNVDMDLSNSCPDLAPSDDYLTVKLRTALSGRHFDSDNVIITAMDNFLEVNRSKECLCSTASEPSV